MRVHWTPLERQLKDWCVWGDDKIKSGQVWRDQISAAMEEADIAVLLLSADFFASEFISNTELPFLLGKAQERQMSILSLVVSPFSENYAQRVLVFQGIHSLDRPLLKK